MASRGYAQEVARQAGMLMAGLGQEWTGKNQRDDGEEEEADGIGGKATAVVARKEECDGGVCHFW